jgi:ABC-2 type transport system ATP-binding protein
MTNILQLIDVHKSFGNHQVLNGFSLRVDEGEIWGLLGPNGCGKSTALNIVCNLLSCDKGQVILLGTPIHKLNLQLRSVVGFCTQSCAFYPDLTPTENLYFFGRLYGLSKTECQQRVDELLHDFALNDFSNTRSGQLSGGWQQRLHLAISLVNRPKLLLLDEPTSAVDVQARMELWHLFEKLRDAGTSILMTSHHLAEAQRLCSKVALMRGGKVVAQGSVPELIARVPAQAVAKVQSEDMSTITNVAIGRGWTVRQHAGELRLFLPQYLSLREIIDALDGINITSLSLHPVSLDDAYLELVGEDPSMIETFP